MNTVSPASDVALVELAADGDRATIHPQGAHATSWRTGDEERLFLSARSAFAPGVAIRGGAPVIFPQFASEGPLPKHGFARTRTWRQIGQTPVTARWELVDDEHTRAIWPQSFVCELSVSLRPRRLELELTVTNTGAAPLSFTAALHTYLRVAEIAQVQVAGLAGLRYRDSADGNAEKIERAEALAIEGEVDRIYFDAPPALTLVEPARRLRVEQDGFVDTVVWNPGAAKGAALADLEPDGYRRFLCIEAAVVGRPVMLAPAASWRGRQSLIA